MYDAKWLDEICKKYGYELKEGITNDTVDMLLEGIEHNEGGCPCVPKQFQTDMTKCPCLAMRKNGSCHCGLYKEQR